MVVRKRVRRVLIVAVAAIAIGVYVRFPIYPTTRSICELIAERNEVRDRWATPHRGATLLIRGSLLGGPDGALGFETMCQGYQVILGVETTPLTVATSSSHLALRALPNPLWRTEERKASAVILARVSSEAQSCFGPGIMVTALAVRTTGPVVTKARPLTVPVSADPLSHFARYAEISR